jgi:hypothetical protein
VKPPFNRAATHEKTAPIGAVSKLKPSGAGPAPDAYECFSFNFRNCFSTASKAWSRALYTAC